MMVGWSEDYCAVFEAFERDSTNDQMQTHVVINFIESKICTFCVGESKQGLEPVWTMSKVSTRLVQVDVS